MRTITNFFPAHGIERFHVLAIDDYVPVTETLEERNHFHAEPHFRRPESRKVCSPKQMPGNAQPAPKLFLPIRGRNEWQHRVVIARAENLSDAVVLQVPEQLPAFDDAMHTFLEIRPRERFQQGPRQRKVYARHILISPNRSWDAVQSKEDLACFPFVVR